MDDGAFTTTTISTGTNWRTYQRRGQPIDETERRSMIHRWGEWVLNDPHEVERPNDDFYQAYPHRDVPNHAFPETAWQRDTQYVKSFLQQGLALVNRSMEAILAEYGHDDPAISFLDRSSMFQLHIYSSMEEDEVPTGATNHHGGWTTFQSWEGLKRRLLHAIMTQDTFHMAVVGDFAAAGHG